MEAIENRQGLKIACLEEIAFAQGFIKKSQFKKLINIYSKTAYGTYLNKILNES